MPMPMPMPMALLMPMPMGSACFGLSWLDASNVPYSGQLGSYHKRRLIRITVLSTVVVASEWMQLSEHTSSEICHASLILRQCSP